MVNYYCGACEPAYTRSREPARVARASARIASARNLSLCSFFFSLLLSFFFLFPFPPPPPSSVCKLTVRQQRFVNSPPLPRSSLFFPDNFIVGGRTAFNCALRMDVRSGLNCNSRRAPRCRSARYAVLCKQIEINCRYRSSIYNAGVERSRRADPPSFTACFARCYTRARACVYLLRFPQWRVIGYRTDARGL